LPIRGFALQRRVRRGGAVHNSPRVYFEQRHLPDIRRRATLPNELNITINRQRFAHLFLPLLFIWWKQAAFVFGEFRGIRRRFAERCGIGKVPRGHRTDNPRRRRSSSSKIGEPMVDRRIPGTAGYSLKADRYQSIASENNDVRDEHRRFRRRPAI